MTFEPTNSSRRTTSGLSSSAKDRESIFRSKTSRHVRQLLSMQRLVETDSVLVALIIVSPLTDRQHMLHSVHGMKCIVEQRLLIGVVLCSKALGSLFQVGDDNAPEGSSRTKCAARKLEY